MDNPETLTLQDGWQQAYNPVEYEHSDASEEIPQEMPESTKKKKKRGSMPLLIIIQLTLCVLILIGAYLLKSFGGDLYKTVHDFYYDNLNNEIILNEDFSTFSLDKLFDKH